MEKMTKELLIKIYKHIAKNAIPSDRYGVLGFEWYPKNWIEPQNRGLSYFIWITPGSIQYDSGNIKFEISVDEHNELCGLYKERLRAKNISNIKTEEKELIEQAAVLGIID
jgi:hypothetical protein